MSQLYGMVGEGQFGQQIHLTYAWVISAQIIRIWGGKQRKTSNQYSVKFIYPILNINQKIFKILPKQNAINKEFWCMRHTNLVLLQMSQIFQNLAHNIEIVIHFTLQCILLSQIFIIMISELSEITTKEKIFFRLWIIQK